MSQGGLRGVSALWGGMVILLAAGCEPPAPIINYSGPRLHVRTPADSIKLFRSGPPDRGYLETGTVEVRCTSERTSSGLVSSGGRGCSYDRAINMARQHASDVGADGLFNISSVAAANGNVAALRATAFRYSSMGEEFPELGATGDRLATTDAPQPAAEQPQPVTALPAAEPQDAEPATAVAAPPSRPGAPVPRTAAAPPLPPMPPVAPQPVAAPPRAPAPQPVMASTRSGPQPPFPPLRMAGPVSAPPAAPAPEPVITPGATAAGAATLLPAEERLQRLKDLRDKQMIPAEIYERRRKEILLEMQKTPH